MARNRKQKHASIRANSVSYVHPSLATKSTKQDDITRSHDIHTVTGRIQHLRRTQNRVPESDKHEDAPSEIALPRIPRRPQAAGPPPPLSWLVRSDEQERRFRNYQREKCPLSSDHLMGSKLPKKLSLRYQAAKAIAKDLNWHVAYDHVYLSTLPVPIKCELMHLVAMFGPPHGCTLDALGCLFGIELETGFSSSTDNEDVSVLDLTWSLGRGLPLKFLKQFWMRGEKKSRVEEAGTGHPIESWEDAVDLGSLPFHLPARFPQLTRLSLAHPNLAVSWPEFLSFSKHLGALTHLSLAHWPCPQLRPAEFVDRSAIVRYKIATEENLLHRYREDHESADLLKTLSRNTPSLTWLSLAGCHAWMSKLYPIYFHAREPRTIGLPLGMAGFSSFYGSGTQTYGYTGAEWSGSWRNVEYVNVSQERLAPELPLSTLQEALDKRLTYTEDARTTPSASPIYPLTRSGVWAGRREPEVYQVTLPDESARNRMELLERVKQWRQNEFAAIQLLGRVRSVRKMENVGRVEFDFGWGKKELVAAGYDEKYPNFVDRL